MDRRSVDRPCAYQRRALLRAGKHRAALSPPTQNRRITRAAVESHIPPYFALGRCPGGESFRGGRLCARPLSVPTVDRHRRGGGGQRHRAGRGAGAGTAHQGVGFQDFRHGDASGRRGRGGIRGGAAGILYARFAQAAGRSRNAGRRPAAP